eukprot:CAMPEP_0167756532 /NCGR_PEP_ID=MMETSP0110_2-20121227/9436_1 /TAXON_ID=629695 /ORGANISM="Gymnochlora sp., Strain CCMP2014" /LENGTH=353 /DNA_ID=CAMNT_0007642649 /DNA_START=119 /DNA_END=1183 /DNA_ORIENTATION=-
MAADYEEAAAEMKGLVNFGEIDCTKQGALKKKYDIKGYPTLKFFRDGKMRDYRSGRSVEDLTSFAMSVSGDAIIDVAAEDIDGALNSHPVLFIYIGEKDSSLYSIFEGSAKKFQGIHFFGSATTSVSDKLGMTVTTPAVIFATKGGKAKVLTEITEESLESFIQKNRFALISEINSYSFADIRDNGKPVVLIVDQKNEDSKKLIDETFSPATTFEGLFLVAKVDGTRYGRYLNQFGIPPNGPPCLLVVDYESEIYWSAPPKLKTSAEIESWLENVLSGAVSYNAIVPWYNPRRYMRKVSKFMSQFSQLQITIMMVVSTLIGAALLFFLFSWCEDDTYPMPTPGEPAENHPKNE